MRARGIRFPVGAWGFAALVLVAHKPLARNLVIASFALTLAPLPVIVLFGDLIAEAGVGTGIRLAFGAGASLLAMAAAILPARNVTR